MMVKRSTLFAVILVFVAGAFTVAWAQTPAPPPAPVIHAQANGATYNGAAGDFCWPGVGSNLCAFVDDPQPTSDIPVKKGDSVLFTVDQSAGAPATFKATLLDDKNADGDAIQANLADTNGVFVVAQTLVDGPHRIKVEAIYPPDAGGNQIYVSYVFRLQIGAVGAVAVIPTGATAGATGAATPTPVSIELETQPANATSAAPPPASTGNATAPGTQKATSAPPTSTPTAVPTQPPPSETPVPTTVPTEAPATSAPTEAATEATAGQAASQNTPSMTITVGGKSFQPIAVNGCTQGDSGEQICINRPVNANAKFVLAAAGSNSQVLFGGPHPTAELITLFNSDGTAILKQQSLLADNLVLYSMPSRAGIYVLTVEVQWPKGKATYYFRLSVSG